MSGLTKAQLRVLRRLATEPGASITIETRERGYLDGPTFHGRWHRTPCPTCGHAEPAEPVSWMTVFALTEKGMLKPALSGGDFYIASGITPAGRTALSTDQEV